MTDSQRLNKISNEIRQGVELSIPQIRFLPEPAQSAARAAAKLALEDADYLQDLSVRMLSNPRSENE